MYTGRGLGFLNHHFDRRAMAELPTELKAQLKEMFDATDTNGNGSIDGAEMKAFCAKMGAEASDEQIAAEMAAFDLNKDGTITFDEMCNVFANLVAGK